MGFNIPARSAEGPLAIGYSSTAGRRLEVIGMHRTQRIQRSLGPGMCKVILNFGNYRVHEVITTVCDIPTRVGNLQRMNSLGSLTLHRPLDLVT